MPQQPHCTRWPLSTCQRVFQYLPGIEIPPVCRLNGIVHKRQKRKQKQNDAPTYERLSPNFADDENSELPLPSRILRLSGRPQSPIGCKCSVRNQRSIGVLEKNTPLRAAPTYSCMSAAAMTASLVLKSVNASVLRNGLASTQESQKRSLSRFCDVLSSGGGGEFGSCRLFDFRLKSPTRAIAALGSPRLSADRRG